MQASENNSNKSRRSSLPRSSQSSSLSSLSAAIRQKGVAQELATCRDCNRSQVACRRADIDRLESRTSLAECAGPFKLADTTRELTLNKFATLFSFENSYNPRPASHTCRCQDNRLRLSPALTLLFGFTGPLQAADTTVAIVVGCENLARAYQ